MSNFRKSLERLAANSLGWGIRGDELRVFFLESLEALKRKESLDKGERISADLFLSANPARCSEKQRPLLDVCQIAKS
jgi:hypothetical protein